MQASRTSILGVRRIRGPEETYHMGGLWGPDDAEILRIEPSFQLILDEEPIGTMEPLTRIGEVIRSFLPPPPIEESSQFEIQAGHHTLRIEAAKRFTQGCGSETRASEEQPLYIATGGRGGVFGA